MISQNNSPEDESPQAKVDPEDQRRPDGRCLGVWGVLELEGVNSKHLLSHSWGSRRETQVWAGLAPLRLRGPLLPPAAPLTGLGEAWL